MLSSDRRFPGIKMHDRDEHIRDCLDSILGWGRIFTRRNLAHSRFSRRQCWIWTFLLVFALDTACVLAFSVWRFRLRVALAQFSSWIVSCPFTSLHYWLQLCDVLKCECSVLHIWFEHGSWTVARRTCWGDQHSRDPWTCSSKLSSCERCWKYMMRLDLQRPGNWNGGRDNVVTWNKTDIWVYLTWHNSNKSPTQLERFALYFQNLTRWRDLNRSYDWKEDLLTEDSVRIENLVLFQCTLSEQPFYSLHGSGFIQSTGDQTVLVKWGGRRISHDHRTRRTKEKWRWTTIVIGKFHSLKCLEWHWKSGMELRFPLEHRSEPPMQKEINGGTSVNTWLQSGCNESTRVPHIAISTGALVISVSAQLFHGGHQILFDAVQWPSISWNHDACSWCATCATASIGFFDVEGCCSEETWVVDVPLGGGQFVSGKSLQGIDEGPHAF